MASGAISPAPSKATEAAVSATNRSGLSPITRPFFETNTTVSPLARGFRLTLDEPAYGVAVGQAAVLYEEEAIVGAGLISASR